MKFRSLVHTYINHRHYLKVRTCCSPCSGEPGSREREEALSPHEETVGLRKSWVRIPTLPLTSQDLAFPTLTLSA